MLWNNKDPFSHGINIEMITIESPNKQAPQQVNDSTRRESRIDNLTYPSFETSKGSLKLEQLVCPKETLGYRAKATIGTTTPFSSTQSSLECLREGIGRTIGG